MQKKNKRTTQYNLLALKRLASKPSDKKIGIEAFKEDENMLKYKNELKSNK